MKIDTQETHVERRKGVVVDRSRLWRRDLDKLSLTSLMSEMFRLNTVGARTAIQKPVSHDEPNVHPTVLDNLFPWSRSFTHVLHCFSLA